MSKPSFSLIAILLSCIVAVLPLAAQPAYYPEDYALPDVQKPLELYMPGKDGNSLNAPVRGGANAFPTRPAAYTEQNKKVGQWFAYYDQIRRHAQMHPSERQHADALLSRGLAILIPGDEKLAAQALLNKLVSHYQQALMAMKSLPVIPETSELHKGYYLYFAQAAQLFTDYLRVQDNFFLKDMRTGRPLAGQLLQRKQQLEGHERYIKELDFRLRQQYNVAPYQY